MLCDDLSAVLHFQLEAAMASVGAISGAIFAVGGYSSAASAPCQGANEPEELPLDDADTGASASPKVAQFHCVAVSGAPHRVFEDEPLLQSVVDARVGINISLPNEPYICMPICSPQRCIGLLLVAYSISPVKKRWFTELDELKLSSASDTLSFLFQRCAAFRSVPPYDLRRLRHLQLDAVLWLNVDELSESNQSSISASPTAAISRTGSAVGSSKSRKNNRKDGPLQARGQISSIVMMYRSANTSMLSKRITSSASGIDAATPRLMLDVAQAITELEDLVQSLRQDLRIAHMQEGVLEMRLRSMQQELNISHGKETQLTKEVAANVTMTQMLQEELQDHRVLAGLQKGQDERAMEEHVKRFIMSATNARRPIRHVDRSGSTEQRKLLPPSAPSTRQLFQSLAAPSPRKR